MNYSQSQTKEHRLIAAIKEWTGESLIGDDCAILPGGQLVTADTLVEGTHFRLSTISFRDLGWKAMAVNLSDVAAMAGRPRYAIVTLTLPQRIDTHDVEQLYAGIVECARTYRCRVVGGDLTRGNEMSISVTVIGDTHENGVLTRDGARVGDVIVATGDCGASAAGLFALENELRDFDDCTHRHVHPLPRLCEAWSLVRCTGGRGAMMDSSDGLADALIQIAHASSVSAIVFEKEIPIADQTKMLAKRQGLNVVELALYGGEDYELLAAVAPADFEKLSAQPECAFRMIGEIVAGSGAFMVRADGEREPLSLDRTFAHW